MSDEGFSAPRLARWWLCTFLPAETAEFLIGDIEEEAARVARSRGRRAARRFYWSQTVRSSASLLSMRGAAGTGTGKRRAGIRWSSGVVTDFQIAVRSLAKTPSFSLVVVFTLALGIGATTAIYSVVEAVLVAPLPYSEPEAIVQISETVEERDGQPVLASYLNFVDWREQATSMERFAAARTGAVVLTGDEDATRLLVRYVSPGYLEIFDGRAQRGRLIEPEDDLVPGGHAVAVVSHRLWQRRFGGEPELVGRSIDLSGQPYVVIGILDAGFEEPFGTGPNDRVDLFLPAVMAGPSHPMGDAILTDRQRRTFSVFGRLAAGVSLERAQDELTRIAGALEEQHPGPNRGFGVAMQTLSDALTQGVRDPVIFLWLGASILLVIACFNVAGLMLVRGSARVKDMAIRLAVGARRSALLRYAFFEALVLALFGGGLGVVAARSSLPAILEINPAIAQTVRQIHVDGSVLVVALAVSLGSGLLFGILPAWRASRVGLRGISLAQRDGSLRSGSRLRRGLVAFQLASAMVLLSSSVIIVRSFVTIHGSESGFLSERLLLFQVQIPETSYPAARDVAAVTEAIQERLGALPGVEWAESWGPGRPGSVNAIQSVLRLGQVVEKITDATLARRHAIGPGALRHMEIALLEGRDLTGGDREDTAPVAIVSASLAEALWPGESPIGKQARPFVPSGGDLSQAPLWTVVGVAADVRHAGRVPVPGSLTVSGDIYFAAAQRPERAPTLLVRTAGVPDVELILQALGEVDRTIPAFNVTTMEEQFATEEGMVRLAAFLTAIFSAAAVFLSSLGVYGVVAFTVSQRTREIGLRTALGADRRATLGYVLRQTAGLAVVGVAAGTAVTLLFGRSVGSLVLGAASVDVATLVFAAVSLVATAFLASSAPAVRATRIAPAIALRD